MFVYNLLSRKPDSGKLPTGTKLFPELDTYDGALQAEPDAVVALFAFTEPDTFSFATQTSNPVSGNVLTGENGPPDELTDKDVMAVSKAILLDPFVISLSAQSAKGSHQDGLSVALKDPNNELLALINPGDWVVCWMCDNKEDADKIRTKLRANSPFKLNEFNSGFKFVGKALAPRMQHMVDGNGSFTKTCTLRATAFSELDAQIYYDPQLNMNKAKGTEFMGEIAAVLGNKFNGVPRTVSGLIGIMLPVLLGNPPRQGDQRTPNQPLRVPREIASILGVQSTNTNFNFMDILDTIIGIQKYDNTYIPPLQQGIDSFKDSPSEPEKLYPHKNIYSTKHMLSGAVYPIIAPFNNVPIWSILQQQSLPVVNEMYSCLRVNQDGLITPHFIARQIPFNTEAFVKNHSATATAFLELPRWKASAAQVMSYDTGKSDSMRVNYVHVQVTGLLTDPQQIALARYKTIPRSDSVDIARNGLKPFITQANGVYEIKSYELGQQWTDLATDRLIGAHLKLSGSITLVGVQEPIAVGDNLEYDGFVYHIESLEHRLQVNPMTGQKVFSTLLALSSGVPVTGPVLPEIATRTFDESYTDTDPMKPIMAKLEPLFAKGKETELAAALKDMTPISTLPQRISTSTLTGFVEAQRHTVVPASNSEGD